MIGRASALAALLVLLLLSGRAGAVGAEGVELTPLLERRGGMLTAVVDGLEPIPLRLTNMAEAARSVRVYAVSAVRADGSYRLGAQGSAPYVDIPGAEEVVLAAGEVRVLEAHLDLAAFRAHGLDHAAFVVEVVTSGNVVPRAATIVRLDDAGVPLPRPVVLLGVALVLILLAGIAWIHVVRSGRATLPVPARALSTAELRTG